MVGFRKNTSQRLDQLDDVITALNTRVEQLEGERTATAHTLNDILERTNSLDARITATTTELARQLNELGNELSAVADQEPIDVAEIVNGSLVDIRQSQTRLAQEQARYQAAFRADIAILIEQLRR
jgi:septal ring factor EnvC (AmiA/AmiB activator)